MEAAYREVPYHNLKHGAAVGRSVFSLCKQPGGLASVLGEEAQFALARLIFSFDMLIDYEGSLRNDSLVFIFH